MIKSLLRSAACQFMGKSALEEANCCLNVNPPWPLLRKIFICDCPQAEPPQKEPVSTPMSSTASPLKSPYTMLGATATEFAGSENATGVTTGALKVPSPLPKYTEKLNAGALCDPVRAAV